MNAYDEFDDEAFGDDPNDERDSPIADNEATCDARIEPLMLQIHQICEAYGIPMIASFEVAPHRLCTTIYLPGGSTPQLVLSAKIIRGILPPGSQLILGREDQG
jgi:hypothetical protein